MLTRKWRAYEPTPVASVGDDCFLREHSMRTYGLNLLITTVFLAAASCGPTGTSEESSQISAVEEQAKTEQISLSEMLVRKRAIYRAHSGLDRYQEAYYEKTIIYAKQLESGAINVDQFTLLESEARQNMELSQQVNCMKVRQENQRSDHSGLASTNGFVAIVSMGGLLAESANEARACR